ncbi:Gram-positive sporulation control protein Spo0M [Vibrio fortis]|uniref:Gram-positive sporulation control protein Spo0M n=1 Tax=Vibrio fortis TaxID=212667 RepID=A0A066UT26_9VIBR|nr:sporulation protein [Vibrio fortis]KDN30200.1 Gram-positive sporulation control protein Spo0M [Vibrio fortis]
MFKKLKASLGIGAAKVDTVLDNIEVFQGGELSGNVHILGGDVEQQIDLINLVLNTEVKVETEDSTSYETFSLGRIQAVEPFTIQPGETKQVPFRLKLNDETPITALNAKMNQCHVWVETNLDIGFAIDPKDRDFIVVKPLPTVEKIIQGVEAAGMTMVKADVEKGYLKGNTFSSVSGCYQEIEFRSGGFINNKEIELSFIVNGNTVHCLAEIDRSLSFRGDQYISFSLPINASDSDINAAVSRIMNS